MRPLLAALLLACAVTACGEPHAAVSTLPAGAPWLRRVAGPVDPAGSRATLTLESPARVRVLFRRDAREERTVFDRVLAGSQPVSLAFGAAPRDRAPRLDPLPPRGEEDAGRPEIHAFALRVTVEGHFGVLSVEPTVWTRVGCAQVLTRARAVPRMGEEVPFDTDVELVTVAVADSCEADLVLQTVEGRTSARLVPAEGPHDRVHLLRLILRVEPLGDGRSETP